MYTLYRSPDRDDESVDLWLTATTSYAEAAAVVVEEVVAVVMIGMVVEAEAVPTLENTVDHTHCS